jgi:hypothetical protein
MNKKYFTEKELLIKKLKIKNIAYIHDNRDVQEVINFYHHDIISKSKDNLGFYLDLTNYDDKDFLGVKCYYDNLYINNDVYRKLYSNIGSNFSIEIVINKLKKKKKEILD